jgi:antirestriction protein ArdC
MKSEEIKKMTDSALTELIQALEQGKSECLQNYLSTMARFHCYSWGNVLLISMQKPQATRVAGYQTWLKMNRHVRKGEKGIVIIAPMVVRKKETELSEDEETRLFGFRAAYVFDVTQTDGQALPEFAQVQGDPGLFTERLFSFATKLGIAVELSEELGSASGVSTGGKILLKSTLAPADTFAVLVHELAHERLHHGDGRERTDKRVRETEAEAVAFVVSQAVGLDTNTAAADYIQLYQGDKALLVESLHFIQTTAAEILNFVLPGEERQTP